MSTQALTHVTLEQYLEQEEKNDYKSEYYQGEVFPMVAGDPSHSKIIVNAILALGSPARVGRCSGYAAARLRVTPTGLYTYPDILYICGKPEYTDARKHTLTNPKLIIEVLSDSTADYDLGRKFHQYRTLPSLTEFIAIATRSPSVYQYVRQSDHAWLLTESEGTSQTLSMASLGCDLPLSAIYDGIEFDTA